MDTIVAALNAFDSVGTEYVAHPETEVKAVVGLQAELNKIIKAITVSGGTITLTKTDGTTFTATINNASTSVNGLMSTTDKTKLDGFPSKNNSTTQFLRGDGSWQVPYTLPNATASALGGVKVGSNISVSSGTISLTKDNVTSALGYTPGTGSGSVTGVKGNSESSYRSGNVNLTAANVGAADSSHTHAASDITSGTLPVARGGTGQTSLASVTGVGSANKLATARTIQTNLASTSSASFDGTANVTPGVTGILPIANGGTGRKDGQITTFRCQYLSSTNLNELFTNGFFEGTFTNGPAERGWVIVYDPNDGATITGLNIWQIFFGIFVLTSTTTGFYVRRTQTGVGNNRNWGDWKQIV